MFKPLVAVGLDLDGISPHVVANRSPFYPDLKHQKVKLSRRKAASACRVKTRTRGGTVGSIKFSS